MSQYARYSGLGSGGGGGGSGVTTVGAIDSQTPSSNGLVIVSTTIYAQSASTLNPGLVNNTIQSFSGNKTFTGTISAANLSGTNTGDVTIGTANGLSILGQVLSLALSSTSTTGALSSTDWNTFNNKQPAGSYITALTGDVSAIGPGSVAATVNSVGGSSAANIHTAELATNAATDANTPSTIVKRDASGNFSASTITASLIGHASLDIPLTQKAAVNGVATLDGTGKIPLSQLPASLVEYQGTWDASTNTPTLSNASGPYNVQGFFFIVSVAGTVNFGAGPITFNSGDWVLFDGSVWQRAVQSNVVQSVNGQTGIVTINAINQLTGDVVAGPASQSQSQSSTIQPNVVSNSKLAQMPTHTYKGNNTGSTANALDLTSTQVTADLNLFTSSLQGLVPASGGGTTNFLRADGTFAIPPGTGTATVTSVALADSTGTFSITGSPVTSSGTLTLSAFQSQAQHTFLAAPFASSGAPTFRLVDPSDIPTLNQNTTGTASNITGTVLITHGGTGQTTTTAAFNALSPLTTAGDIIYENITPSATRLPIGSGGQILTVSGGLPIWANPATSGTVTSVALADGSTTPIFTISGSPVTSSGTLTETLITQTANTVFAGPTGAGPTQPTFRALIAADLPTGNLTDAGIDGITITNGTSAVIGTGTSIAQHVADSTHNGYLSSTDWSTFNNKQPAGNYITALTGDATAAGPGSVAITLATVNSNVGTFGSSTSIPTFTVNAKGLITAASGNAVIAPAGTLSGTTLNATVVSSSLTSVGTITTGVWNGTTIDVSHGGTSLTTLTANNVILGNGTSAPLFVAPGTTGNVLTSNGTTWTSVAATTGANTFLSNLTSPTAVNQELNILSVLTLTNAYTTSFWGGPNPGLFAISTAVGPSGSNALLFVTTDINGTVPDDTSADITVGTGANNNTSPSPTAKTGDLYLQTGYQNEPTSSGTTGTMFINTGNSFGSGTTGDIQIITGPGGSTAASGNLLLQTGPTDIASGNIVVRTGLGVGTRGKIQLQNGSEGTPGQAWISTDASGSGAWTPLSGTSAFAAYFSSKVSTDSSSITSGTFTTFSNSPAFTITPTISGTYKVYCAIPLDVNTTTTQANGRIFNTSGGATLLAESQSTIGVGTNSYIVGGSPAQSLYTLTAGITYVFDIQGQVVNGNAVLAIGLETPFYIFAEGVSLNGASIVIPSMRYYGSSSTISSSLNTVTYTTQDYDNFSAYSSGSYTIPTGQDGKYQVNAGLLIASTISLNNTLIMEIQKNGSVVSRKTIYLPAALTDGTVSISDIISCVATDTLRIRVSTSSLAPSIVASNFDNYLSICKVG